MFPECGPSSRVFPSEQQTVSEFEKITRELLKFMQDFFRMSDNSAAVDAMSHFAGRIEKCGVKINEDANITNNNYDNLTI